MTSLKSILNITDQDRETIRRLNFHSPAIWLALWFGSGLLRPAPGTWGSLAAIPPAMIIGILAGPWAFLIATTLLTALGFWACKIFENQTEVHDCKMVVIDEAAGQWIALAPLFFFGAATVAPVFMAFLLFRVFDVLKPWPISHFDRNVTGPVGVMGDDILAGMSAALIMIAGLFYVG